MSEARGMGNGTVKNGVCSSESVNGGEDMWSCDKSAAASADHLVVMVHGILGSSKDWKFAAEQFVRMIPDKVFVHRSERNTAGLTLDGVDVMGDRLAEEILELIKQKPSLHKISFVAHSVGGLVARYVIGRLFRPPRSNNMEDSLPKSCEELSKGTIGGLEPMNFITSATPHLGSRGNKQLFYLEHCTPAEYFTSRCGMRPSPRFSAWEDKDIRERACWFNKTSKRKCEKVKIIIEDGVGKRERMMNQGKEVDHDKSMENDQVKNLTSMVERMSSLLEETLVAMHEKDHKRKYFATYGGINKDTPSALEEPDVERHFKTKKAKCTENALSDQMTSPPKTNKEKGKEEAKLNASSKTLRKMAANVREALSRTAPAIDGKKKWENKLKTNRFDKSQPLKRNANKKPTMEAESKRADVMATLSNEKQLMLRYVFDHTQSEREIFCDLGIEHLNRHDFFLHGRTSGLINLVALKKTLLQKKRYPNGL